MRHLCFSLEEPSVLTKMNDFLKSRSKLPNFQTRHFHLIPLKTAEESQLLTLRTAHKNFYFKISKEEYLVQFDSLHLYNLFCSGNGEHS